MQIAKMASDIATMLDLNHPDVLTRAVDIARQHAEDPTLHALSIVDKSTASAVATALFRDAGFTEAVVIAFRIDGNDL